MFEFVMKLPRLNAVTMRLLVFALAAADFRVRFDVETTEVNVLQQFV